MARDRFPSDERRVKQRPHVKVHLTWPTHPRFGKVYADPILRSTIVGLWLVAVRAHASETGDTVHLGLAQLIEVTGCTSPGPAVQRLRSACRAMRYPVSGSGAQLAVTIRNLSKKQGFASARSGVPPPTPPPSEEPKNQGTKEPTPAAERGGGSARNGRGSKRLSEPEPWALEAAEHMAARFAEIPGAPKKPKLKSWARALERIPGAYGATPDEVRFGIEWVLSPERVTDRYTPVVRSGQAAYDKWPQIVDKAGKIERERQPTSEELSDSIDRALADRRAAG